MKVGHLVGRKVKVTADGRFNSIDVKDETFS